MLKITDKLNIIKNAKDDIKSSIEAKGVEVGDVSIEEYASKIDKLKTSNLVITNANCLFYSGSRLDQMEEIMSLLGKITTAYQMYQSSSDLTFLDLSKLDTSELKRIDWIFASCGKIKELILFDMGAVTNIQYAFYNTRSLEIVKNFYNLGKAFTQKQNNYSSYGLDLSSCTLLTHESLMNIINGLYDLNLTYDVANGGKLYTQKLILGTDNIAKLTAEEIAIATNKGWVVS